MEQTKVLAGIGAVALALTFTACSSDAGASSSAGSIEEMEAVTLKVATIYGPDNYSTKATEAYTEKVTELTDGKVNFEYFYAGSLLPQPEMAQGLADGIIDFAEFMPVYTPAMFPVDGWAAKLGFMSDPSPIVGGLQSRSATLELGFHDEAFIAEMENNNLHAIEPRLQPVHGYDLLCKEPVASMEDLQGKRVRVGGEAWAGEIENLGGTPVTIPAAEAFTALQQGVVDCHLGGAQEIDGLGLTDIAKYYTPLNLTGWTSAAVAMNMDTWESLPAEAQAAFSEALPTYNQARAEFTYAATFEFFANAEANGLNFVDADAAMREQVATYHKALVEELPESAPAEIADPAALIASYQDAHARWYETLTEELGLDASAQSWAEYVAANNAVDADFAAWSNLLTEIIPQP